MSKSLSEIDEIHEIILNCNTLNKDFEIFAEQIFTKGFKSYVNHWDNASPEGTSLNDIHNVTNQEQHFDQTADDLWIFGYGSLVWKADFPYIDKKRGFIRGFQRRFYQNSIDHRGTLSKPGRVVTLIPSSSSINDRVYGVAYRIANSQKERVLDHLDYREKNGYQRCILEFVEFPAASSFDVMMYVATMENESFAGNVWELEDIAEQIFRSVGPSGTNLEYLFNLANSMRLLFPGVHDTHLFGLESLVKQRIQQKLTTGLTHMLKQEIQSILYNSQNTDIALAEIKLLKEKCENGWLKCMAKNSRSHMVLVDKIGSTEF